MAKATAKYSAPELEGVTLELTPKEAEILRSLLWTAIIGKSNGRRGALDDIGSVLQQAGVEAPFRYTGMHYLNADDLEER